MSLLGNLTWKKACTTLGSCASVGAGIYIYLLIPSAEPQNVEEVLNRAGFESIENASEEELIKIALAYKAALESGEKSEIIDEVEIKDKSDKEIGEQIKGGCRSLVKGSATSNNKNTGRRWCVVSTPIHETLKKQGIRFLDVIGDDDNRYWDEKVDLLMKSGKADDAFEKASATERINMIKGSCSDLKTAPTTTGDYNSFLSVATTYCSIRE